MKVKVEKYIIRDKHLSQNAISLFLVKKNLDNKN